ncbi:MAG: hypothetical protein HQK91_09830 [Nitrospirae bacterium]|nr:hypothetical protein [Nitrospirota bacterium]MBF0541733.1 hypothetical protein [Nitrospirota bacterium]
MENNYVRNSSGTDISQIVKNIINEDTLLLIVFYGADVDSDNLFDVLKKTGRYFIGCMDYARMSQDNYLLDTHSITVMSFSKHLFESITFGIVNMSEDISYDKIRADSLKELIKAAEAISLDLANPNMKKEFIVNLLYGLNSATPFLEGQTQASMMLHSVGGSSGGKTDFLHSNVMCHLGIGKIGVFMAARLALDFEYEIGRVSCFELMKDIELEVTRLYGPRHILEFNHREAALEYCDKLMVPFDQLTVSVFANYTLGIDPGDGELLITSLMKKNNGKGLIAYNDVVDGTVFNIYKAVNQVENRKKLLQKINQKHVISYVSFDCILCYLARNSMNQTDEIAGLYNTLLPDIPKIGFGTFSENICGANINQTETFLSIYKIH